MAKRLIICDCAGSQRIDAKAVETLGGVKCSRLHSALCTDEIAAAASQIEKGNALIACRQEAALFEELAEELGAPQPAFVDLRDRAGWSDDGAAAGPKMAALVADARLDQPMVKMVDVVSEGRCLIIGAADVALAAAGQLTDALAVTALLPGIEEVPADRRFDLVTGDLKKASGTFGAFTVRIDALRQVLPGGRGALNLGPPRDGASSECDIILDLSGATPLFPAPEKRDGYLRADPRDPNAVARVLVEAVQMTGTFEKPLHVRMEPHLCAHSRASITGCSNCLDACPTGAIAPNGDFVSVDPMVCAGCGACASLCPSGAISYDAPDGAFQFRRMQAMAEAFRKAGGASPRLLVHDTGFGDEMISLAARFGRGLPGDVIPMAVPALAGFGHAEMLAALACGFARVDILLAPSSDRDTITREQGLATAIAGTEAVGLLDLNDPEQLSEILYERPGKTVAVDTPILPMGSRRQIARLAATALVGKPGDPVALPTGAPYGAVHVDPGSCTLCLSCASLCPTGALADNPDAPQLRFQEDACLQCGLCAALCPEKAITLEPRLDLADAAMSQKVLHEEEPFECVECGKPFGVRATIEKITAKLAGKHAMFATSAAARMIQMCDDCRVQAQYHAEDNPFQAADRPRVVTTEDYFSKRKDH